MKKFNFNKYFLDPTLLDISNSLKDAFQIKDEKIKYLKMSDIYKRYANI